MMKKLIKSSIAMLLVVCCILGTTQVAFAASPNLPYGYTYEDAATGRTMYKYYSYDSKRNTYVPSYEYYSRGTTVCRSNGIVVTNLSAGSGSRYNGFASGGKFYCITNKGELICTDTNYKVTTLIKSGAKRLFYDADELATIVSTSSGNKYIATLTAAPEVDDDDNVTIPVKKASNRVEIYTNSAGELVYDAYSNNKLKTTIVTSSNGQKILNETAKVRLSDSVKGAKFMGFDSSYNVYLYELNGTLYRFKYGKWYSAERISLNGTFKSFKTDDNGFISKVVTSKSSYTLKQLTTSNKWKATKTYTVSKSGYVTLYTKGSTSSNTLMLKSGTLTLNGKKIATGVTRYGFVSSKKFSYIKKGIAYTATLTKPTKAVKLCSKAKTYKKNSVGLLSKVVLTSNKTKALA